MTAIHRLRPIAVAVRALMLAVPALLLGGCAETAVKVGLQTRSAIYANSLLEGASGARALLTSNPPRVGILQGSSPGAPIRGLGPFASDAVRVALHRRCPGSTVVSGPTVAGLAAQAGKSPELARLLREAHDTGILNPADLRELGTATGLEWFFLAIVASNDVRDSTRFTFFGVTAVRSNWTTSNLTLQLYHAPTGRIAWQSVGDCTEYTESLSSAPVPLHVVMSELAGVMVNDLLQSRSRTSLLWITNQKQHLEPEHANDASDAHPLPEDPSDVDSYLPADRPEIEPEPRAMAPGR